MSYCSRTRPRRVVGGVAPLVAGLLAGAGLPGLAPAHAVPGPGGSPGTIQTMGGVTRSYQQGGYGPEGVLATESQFQNPRGLNFAPNGDVYITDALNHRVRRIDQAGVVHLVAGTGIPGHAGDGGDARSAQLNEPHGVAVDSEGNVYIADSKNCVIRKVDTAGVITRYAGTGAKNPANPAACAKTDGTPDGPILTIALDQPKSLFLTTNAGADTLWIADMGNSQIRKIELDSPNPTNVRVAGTNRRRHYGGDGGNSLDAELRHPEGVWVANDGTIYISDGGNNLVRKVAMPVANSTQRIITTIVGDAAAAEANKFGSDDLPGRSDGDGGPASNARLDKPRGISGDNRGNLYIAEEHGSRIRRVKLSGPGGPTIDTIAGDGTILEQRANGGSSAIPGENGPALHTQFAMLHDIQVNPADGSLWIADSRNNRVRAIADAASAPGAVVPTGGNPVPPSQPAGGGAPVAVPGQSGYWMLGNDGRVYAFGDARSAVFGEAGGLMASGARAVHIEPTPTAGGLLDHRRPGRGPRVR